MASNMLIGLLPQRALMVFPLYIGVELILGFAIINKAGGLFGILSLFTGHPINFWQWLYNFLALLVLPVYTTALTHLQTRPLNVRKISIACIVYVADTFIGLLFTLYFVHFWFSDEENTKSSTKSTDPTLASQSASSGRELFLTASATILFLAARVYFMFVVISFTRILIKQTEGQRLVAEDEEEEVARDGRIAKIKGKIIEYEVRATEFLTDYFRS